MKCLYGAKKKKKQRRNHAKTMVLEYSEIAAPTQDLQTQFSLGELGKAAFSPTI